MLNVNSGRDTLELLVRSVIDGVTSPQPPDADLESLPQTSTLLALHKSMSRNERNPNWGCPRIAQQMALAFHIQIEKDVVRSILARTTGLQKGAPTQIQPKQFKEMEENALKES